MLWLYSSTETILDSEHWWMRPLKHLSSWGQGSQASQLFHKESQSSISFFFNAPLLVHIWCFSWLLSPLQKEDLMCSWCCSSHFWFCELSLCVQQNALLICRPLCLLCALFLILKIVLLVVIQCFPGPSECNWTSLCLLWRSRCPHTYPKCLYIVPGCAITVPQNMFATVLFYAYVWVQDKLILILPRLMHFSGVAIKGLCFDYTAVKIVYWTEVYLLLKEKMILCEYLHLYCLWTASELL